MDANEARTLHMREQVAKAGGPAEWARRFGGTKWQQPQVSQWISDAHPKGIGKKLARELELVQGLPRGCLDMIPAPQARPPALEKQDLAGRVAELQNQVESLTVLLASLIGVSAAHRPIEGEALALRIRETGSPDLMRHHMVTDMLAMLDQHRQRLAKAAAPAHKKSPA